MENFKINDYSTNEQDKRSFEQGKGVEEFQNLNLDSLKSLDPAQQKEIVETQKRSEKEALDDLNNIYALAERYADRDDSSFLLHGDENQRPDIIYFEGYYAGFATCEGREDEFSLREKQFKTQKQLVQEISTMKSVRREVPAGQRLSNIFRAISGKIAA